MDRFTRKGRQPARAEDQSPAQRAFLEAPAPSG
jgi:hypothetical protein